MISEAIDKVGKDGVITVEESQTFGMEMDLVEGMRFDKGYISPYFVTDPERMEAVLDDPYVLLVSSKISSVRDLVPVLEKVMQGGRPLVIIAEDVEGEALATLVVNKIRGTFKSAAVKAPASASAARRCSRTWPSSPAARSSPRRSASSWRTSRSTCSARPSKVIVTKDETTIVEGGGSEDDIKGRINQIKAEIENTDSDYDREKLQERLAKLSGGVAVLKVGAATEVELKEKKHRIEDAVSTTKAAIEEGVVPGGGVSLLRAQAAVLKAADGAPGRRGHRRPHRRQVARGPAQADRRERRPRGWRRRRAGARPVGRRGPQRRHRRLRGPGQDRRHRRRQGDPLGAAERAASIAALFLTTEAVIADKPEKEAPAMPGGWTSEWVEGGRRSSPSSSPIVRAPAGGVTSPPQNLPPGQRWPGGFCRRLAVSRANQSPPPPGGAWRRGRAASEALPSRGTNTAGCPRARRRWRRMETSTASSPRSRSLTNRRGMRRVVLLRRRRAATCRIVGSVPERHAKVEPVAGDGEGRGAGAVGIALLQADLGGQRELPAAHGGGTGGNTGPQVGPVALTDDQPGRGEVQTTGAELPSADPVGDQRALAGVEVGDVVLVGLLGHRLGTGCCRQQAPAVDDLDVVEHRGAVPVGAAEQRGQGAVQGAARAARCPLSVHDALGVGRLALGDDPAVAGVEALAIDSVVSVRVVSPVTLDDTVLPATRTGRSWRVPPRPSWRSAAPDLARRASCRPDRRCDRSLELSDGAISGDPHRPHVG